MIQSHLGSKWQEDREGGKCRERYLAPPLGTAATPDGKCMFSSFRILASAVFHTGCFSATATRCPEVKVNRGKREGEYKTKPSKWFPQSLSFKSSFFCSLSQEFSRVSFCSTIFTSGIWLCWDQARYSWRKKYMVNSLLLWRYLKFWYSFPICKLLQ